MELTRSDHPYLDSLVAGEFFDGYYVLRSIQLSTTRANKPYLTFEFTDKTGRMKGKMWEDAANVYRALKQGDIVKIRAGVVEYQGTLELNVKKIRTVSQEDLGDNYARFVPASERNPDLDWTIIRNAVDKIENDGIKELCELCLNDSGFCDLFERSPAGKLWHHGYLGGLLEHTASMVKLVEMLTDHYGFLNRDLMVAGAFFHDVGKIEELTCSTSIDYSMQGRLLGHIVLGTTFLNEKAKQCDKLEQETLVLLQHLVLSHQGTRENGCPVLPMTREAFVLYYIDEIDSKLNAINRELDKADGGSGEFTGYIKLLDRMLFKG